MDKKKGKRTFKSIVNTEYAASSNLNEAQKRMFECFITDKHTRPVGVFVHMNSEAHNEHEFARGYAAILDVSSKVNIDFMHHDACAQVMLFKVDSREDGGALDAADYESRDSEAHERLDRIVEQHTVEEASLKRALFASSGNTDSPLLDASKWQASLGKNGRVGMLKHEVSEDAYEFYLFVYVGQTQASSDLYRWLYEQEPGSLTCTQFVNSPQYKYVRSVNERNARRLAAKAAKALHVKIALCADEFAHTSSAHEMKPQMAVPCVHDELNMMYTGVWDHVERVFVYDNTYCTSKAKGGLLLMQDPQSSVLLFPPVSSDVEGVTLNEAAASFPHSLGHAKSVDEAKQSAHASKMSNDYVRKVNKRVIWQGKERNGLEWSNHRVAPGLHKKVSLATDERQHSTLMKLYDSDLSQMVRLQPVIMKISTDTE